MDWFNTFPYWTWGIFHVSLPEGRSFDHDLMSSQKPCLNTSDAEPRGPISMQQGSQPVIWKATKRPQIFVPIIISLTHPTKKTMTIASLLYLEIPIFWDAQEILDLSRHFLVSVWKIKTLRTFFFSSRCKSCGAPPFTQGMCHYESCGILRQSRSPVQYWHWRIKEWTKNTPWDRDPQKSTCGDSSIL